MQPFEEAFPELKDVRVEAIQLGHSEGGCDGKPRYYGKDARGYIDCHHPECYGGGVWFGKIVREMIAREETDRDEDRMCDGFEGTPKRPGRSCIHRFQLKIHLDYK